MIEAVKVIYEQTLRPEDVNSANAEPFKRFELSAAQREQIMKAGATALCTETEVSGTMVIDE